MTKDEAIEAAKKMSLDDRIRYTHVAQNEKGRWCAFNRRPCVDEFGEWVGYDVMSELEDDITEEQMKKSIALINR